MWTKPGQTVQVPKVSYVKGFAPWALLVGSGVYMDTIAATFYDRLVDMVLGALVLGAALVGIGVAIARAC